MTEANQQLVNQKVELLQVKAGAYDRITKLETQLNQVAQYAKAQDQVLAQCANLLECDTSNVVTALEKRLNPT